jgi:hypothetical protein
MRRRLYLPTLAISAVGILVMLVGGVRISLENMHLPSLALCGGDWRRVPGEAGGSYVALLDVFHQINCLVSPPCLHHS